MLLEYTEETREADMGATALEVRKRVAGRALDKALKSGLVDAAQLVEMKQTNNVHLKALRQDNIAILDTEISSRVAIARSEQHLDLTNAFREVKRDLSRVVKLSKARLDTLSELERRILHMRSQLTASSLPTVDEDISNIGLGNSGRTHTQGLFTLCARCEQRVLTRMLHTHQHTCLRLSDATASAQASPPSSEGSDAFAEHVTFLPQSPRNFRVAAVGCTHIQWSWDPPVMDGGLPILDYELRYRATIRYNDEESGRELSHTEEVPAFSTSLWCAKKPVAHFGYNLSGLVAGCEYYDFEVRSVNGKGHGEWAAMLTGSVRTDDPDPPTAPLHLAVARVTSSCVHLSWAPPLFDGGRAVTGYAVSYVVLEREVGVTARVNVIERPNAFKIKGPLTSVVIRNLPSSTVVKDITLRARNKAGLFGQESVAQTKSGREFLTAPSSRCSQLQQQLRIVAEILDSEPNRRDIDTAFLAGYQQRIGVDEFIKVVADELRVTPEDAEELEEGREWSRLQAEERSRKERAAAAQAEQAESIRDADRSEERLRRKEQQLFVFTHLQRRAHYRIRIRELEDRLQRQGKESFTIDASRTEMSMLMKRLQLRQIVLNQERDRVRGFKGSMVTSSVLHGAEMKYEIHAFKKDLDKACVECANEISASKLSVIAGEDRRARIKEELEKAELRLSDRRAKLLLYMKVHEKEAKKLNAMLAYVEAGRGGEDAAQQDKLKRWGFATMKRFGQYWRGAKMKLFDKVKGKLRRYYWLAFCKWSRRDAASAGGASISRGGVSLDKARCRREELQGLLREVMADASSTRQQLQVAAIPREPRRRLVASSAFRSSEEGRDHSRLGKVHGGMHLLYEGDGMVRAAKLELARSLYEAQIISIRSRGEDADGSGLRRLLSAHDINLLAITHGRMGKLFFLQKRVDRALVEFDRQLSLANEVDDDTERAEAYLGMGSAYLAKAELDDAVRYLDTAQGKFFVVGNVARQCVALKGLQECYSRKYEPDIAASFAKQVMLVEDELAGKFKVMGDALAAMTGRLVRSSSAAIEKIVRIERCSAHALGIRRRIRELEDSIPLIEEERDKQLLRVDAQLQLLADIQAELSAANATEETTMRSRLLLNQADVVVDVEELKSRLLARQSIEADNLAPLTSDLQRCGASILNVQDTVASLREELAVESCPLMQRSQRSKRFRCLALDSANAAGDSVMGKNTGGVEKFVAAEGRNVHVFRLKTGALLHVLAGDEEGRVGRKTGHTKQVTCLVFDQETIFSGSVDETIIAWDARSGRMGVVFEGHEGTITALAVCHSMLASASADVTTRLWDAASGTQLRVVYGHTKSVLSMELGADWLLTGSADEEARVWSIARRQRSLSVTTLRRLAGHEQPVTCVRYGRLEVLTGDNAGVVLVWWTGSGEVIRRILAHRGMVKTLQFDAVHVVCGGVDGNVVIADIATGAVMQTLLGHEGHVLFVGFDSENVLSLGCDDTLRLYKWGEDAGPQDKHHVLGLGESLVEVCKSSGLSIADLMRWNDIRDTRQLHAGMRLIVAKGCPDQPTKAEKLALDRERRQAGREHKPGAAAVQLVSSAEAALLHPSRIHKLVTEDAVCLSLAQRLFGQTKRDRDMFPSTADSEGSLSLAARLQNKRAPAAANLHLRAPVIISAETEEEWGAVCEALARAMLEVHVEREVFGLCAALLRPSSNASSLAGRLGARKEASETLDRETELGEVPADAHIP